MKKTIKFETIFRLSENILAEIENPNWNSGGRVHNWKNHVDDDVKKIWKQLTFREKTILAHYAQSAASSEDWDYLIIF